MSALSSIEWTDASWQPISGCSRVSLGCENCYAERMAGTRLRHTAKYAELTRMTSQGARWTGKTRFNESDLLLPLRWKKPRRIFVCSMADLFHESVPFQWIDKVFALMALCPQHTFQVLTKRPERMAEYLNNSRQCWIAEAALALPYSSRRRGSMEYDQRAALGHYEGDLTPSGFSWNGPWPLPNVWIGTSCENQETANERIPHLLKCPGAIKFLSCEPLLEELNLNHDLVIGGDMAICNIAWLEALAWVVVGGESGPNARPCVIGHIRSIVKQCKAANVPVFVKQLGSNPTNREGVKHPIRDHHNIEEFPEDLRVREWPA